METRLVTLDNSCTTVLDYSNPSTVQSAKLYSGEYMIAGNLMLGKRGSARRGPPTAWEDGLQ